MKIPSSLIIHIIRFFNHKNIIKIAKNTNFLKRKTMINECIKWCKEKGVEQLELEVVTQNSRAISMYKNLGFEVYGTKKHALKYSDGTYADEYYMILFLNSGLFLPS